MMPPENSAGGGIGLGGAADARMELAVAAAATERANKPRWIIALGIVLLVGTTIFALTALSSRAAMMLKVKDARARTQKITDIKEKLDEENKKLAARGTTPNPRMGQAIEELAKNRGVTLGGPVGDSMVATTTQLGMQQHNYTARASNQDPLAVFNWLNDTQQTPETVGLEIARLVLHPGGLTPAGTPGWNVDVQFSRWEKR